MRIESVGMTSPVGMTAMTSCAAMRAAISSFEELPIDNPLPTQILGGFVPYAVLHGFDRLVEILTPALVECIDGCDPALLSDCPLLLGISEGNRPDHDRRLDSDLIAAVSAKAGVAFHPEHSQVFSRGRTSVLVALRKARRLLAAGEATRCFIAGIDSMINDDCVGWHYQNRRLKLADNPDGLLPGEAAAVIQMVPASAPLSRPMRIVTISGVGYGKESATVLSGQPNQSDGLTTAIKSALDEAGMTLDQIDYRISDVNGEQYYFRETATALSRLLRVHKEGFPIWHCADSIGDTGAAVGGIALIMAFAAAQAGYAPGPMAICQTSSDSGERAAAVLKALN